MGRKSKHFIGKGEGQKYILVHRSRTDDAYKNEERPSDFVLMKTTELQTGTDQRKRDETSASTSQSSHITPLGFKNDGYDYSQHLKVMGGGRFIGRDGSVQNLPIPTQIELPSDALPSEGQLERDLGAITISSDLMDKDIAAALFGDDSGEFEELADDFVIEAMKEPEMPNFDFDAHISNLIAQSERQTGLTKARGWDDGDGQRYVRLHGKHNDDDDELDGEGEDEEGEEVESYCEDDDEDNDDESDAVTERGRGGEGEAGYEERMAFLEAQLELTLEQYGEDDIGDLGEVEGGCIEFEGNTALDLAMEEFLQEQADQTLAEGVLVKKGARVIPEYDDSHEQNNVDFDVKKAADALNEMILEEIIREKDEIREQPVDLLTCQEYLRETREELEWDCESILSTYSTLDNHPTLIVTPSSRQRRGNKNKGAPSESSSASAALINGPQKILLTGKHLLPKGYTPKDVIKSMLKIEKETSSRRLGQMPRNQKEVVEVKDDGEDDDSEDSSETCCKADVLVRRKGETAEEKKARKAKVKDEKRIRREQKKNIKEAFKQELTALTPIPLSGNLDPHVSIFKY